MTADSGSSPGPIARVAVVGTGLMGTSVAMAAARAGAAVTGWDADPSTTARAAAIGGFTPSASLEEAVELANLVVVCTPIQTIAASVAAALAATTDAIVTEVGSIMDPVARQVADRADRAELPRYVPGHPMGGSERSGPEHASPSVLDGIVWVVSATDDSDLRVRSRRSKAGSPAWGRGRSACPPTATTAWCLRQPSAAGCLDRPDEPGGDRGNLWEVADEGDQAIVAVGGHADGPRSHAGDPAFEPLDCPGIGRVCRRDDPHDPVEDRGGCVLGAGSLAPTLSGDRDVPRELRGSARAATCRATGSMMLPTSVTIASVVPARAAATDVAIVWIGVQTTTRFASSTASSSDADGVKPPMVAARAVVEGSTSHPVTAAPIRAAAIATEVPISPVPTTATRATGPNEDRTRPSMDRSLSPRRHVPTPPRRGTREDLVERPVRMEMQMSGSPRSSRLRPRLLGAGVARARVPSDVRPPPGILNGVPRSP